MKVLIANRGEIAVRLIRTLKYMGIRTVAVYSDPDRDSPHVRMADEAVPLHGTASRETYLDIDKILEAIRVSKAEAVHPGYGFLSENPEFRKACDDKGVLFIGPPASAIETMGNKLMARQTMAKAGVPVVPGSLKPTTTIEDALEDAKKAGFPVMIKAVAGGGGKGMRIVRREEEIIHAFESAGREAMSAFGDPSLYIEKYLKRPRHIEVQILGDKYGNVIHLFERECSVQRRHQKVIEETPAQDLPKEVRDRMCNVAVQAARAIGYHCAGTVEFLVDEDKRFYFLEMNTRLQVEHPITEMVLGVDLVSAMVRVAMGEEVPFRQEDMFQRGHAIECRVYAEDPFQDFLPAPGHLFEYERPGGPFVRVDDGVEKGIDISPYYDPLIAKLICWGENRKQAIERTISALKEYRIGGVRHNIPFLLHVLTSEEFESGVYDTGIIEKIGKPPMEEVDPYEACVACVSLILQPKRESPCENQSITTWRQMMMPTFRWFR